MVANYLGLARREERQRRLRSRAEVLQTKYGLTKAEAWKMAWELERLYQEEKRNASPSG